GGLFIRTRGPADAQVEGIRRSLQQLMPGVSYVTATPMSKILGGETQSWRLGATMFAVFGGLALVLAAIGLYSVIAYNVQQRTHELGVRVALGAQMGDVVRMVVGEGFRLAAIGVVLGTVAALWTAHWVRRHGEDSQIGRSSRRLGGEQRVGDRRLRGLRRGLKEWRDVIVGQHPQRGHAVGRPRFGIRGRKRDEDVAGAVAAKAALA